MMTYIYHKIGLLLLLVLFADPL